MAVTSVKDGTALFCLLYVIFLRVTEYRPKRVAANAVSNNGSVYSVV
jgi:hypothetical protein